LRHSVELGLKRTGLGAPAEGCIRQCARKSQCAAVWDMLCGDALIVGSTDRLYCDVTSTAADAQWTRDDDETLYQYSCGRVLLNDIRLRAPAHRYVCFR